MQIMYLYYDSHSMKDPRHYIIDSPKINNKIPAAQTGTTTTLITVSIYNNAHIQNTNELLQSISHFLIQPLGYPNH